MELPGLGTAVLALGWRPAWLHTAMPIRDLGTPLVSLRGHSSEVAWRSEHSTSLQSIFSVGVRSSSGGGSTAAVPASAWASVSVWGQSWKQGDGFFTPEACGAHSLQHQHFLHAEWRFSRWLSNLGCEMNFEEAQHILENKQRVKSLELEVRRLLTLPRSLCETLHNSCYLSASVSTFINCFLPCVIWISSCLGSFER